MKIGDKFALIIFTMYGIYAAVDYLHSIHRDPASLRAS